MMALAFMAAAAAQAPAMIAGRDEAQWRLFVRASVQGPPAGRVRGVSRLRQLQGVVRELGDDKGGRIAGPKGL